MGCSAIDLQDDAKDGERASILAVRVRALHKATNGNQLSSTS